MKFTALLFATSALLAPSILATPVAVIDENTIPAATFNKRAPAAVIDENTIPAANFNKRTPVIDENTMPAATLHDKRNPALEVNYLSDCYTLNPQGQRVWFHAEADYYSDTNQSQNGQWPTSISDVVPRSSRSTFLDQWRGVTQIITFSSAGTTLTTFISRDLDHVNAPVGAHVGDGWNNWRTPYKCYKDNGRVLYRTQWMQNWNGAPVECRARYYCMRGGVYPLPDRK